MFIILFIHKWLALKHVLSKRWIFFSKRSALIKIIIKYGTIKITKAFRKILSSEAHRLKYTRNDIIILTYVIESTTKYTLREEPSSLHVTFTRIRFHQQEAYAEIICGHSVFFTLLCTTPRGSWYSARFTQIQNCGPVVVYRKWTVSS